MSFDYCLYPFEFVSILRCLHSQPEDSHESEQSESEESVDSDDDSFEPSQEKQEQLVERLKRRLPDLDKDVRSRDTLHPVPW